MKKLILSFLYLILIGVLVVSCGRKSNNNENDSPKGKDINVPIIQDPNINPEEIVEEEEPQGPITVGVGNNKAIALKKKDGTVVCVGSSYYGGDCSSVAGLENVVKIFGNSYAFAALKEDGTVVTWGDSSNGGNSSSVQEQLTDVINIYSASKKIGEGDDGGAFAVLKSDGSVVTWGSSLWGGDSSSVAASLSSGVTKIVATFGSTMDGAAFAALKEDGSVVTWGSSSAGGNSLSVASSLNSGVVNIFSSGSAFAALKSDGSVVTWGDSYGGGDYTFSDGYSFTAAPTDSLSSGVSSIFSTYGGLNFMYGGAFAALKSDGSVVTWGDSNAGGDSSLVASSLSSGVVKIFSTLQAFAALKSDGSVVAWGNSSYGGDTSLVSSLLSSGVTKIFANRSAFAALKSDGSVVTWGNSSQGGDSSLVLPQLGSDIENIVATDLSCLYYNNEAAFAALKSDGTVVAWGSSSFGGDTSAILTYTGSSSLTGIVNIFSSDSFFMGVREDETYVVWGKSY